jgi:hypothetical protein
MLCLTVYEAKGLEFDDVILYNFFTDSTLAKNEWKIIKEIKLTKYVEKNLPEHLLALADIDLEEFAKIVRKADAGELDEEMETTERWTLSMDKEPSEIALKFA